MFTQPSQKTPLIAKAPSLECQDALMHILLHPIWREMQPVHTIYD
jgi:hypothetical protein